MEQEIQLLKKVTVRKWTVMKRMRGSRQKEGVIGGMRDVGAAKMGAVDGGQSQRIHGLWNQVDILERKNIKQA